MTDEAQRNDAPSLGLQTGAGEDALFSTPLAEDTANVGEGKASGDAARKRTRRIIAIAAAVTVIIILLLLLRTCSQQEEGSEFFFDPNATEGQAPYKTEEEIKAELDRIVEEGMFNISIASVIEFADGASEGVAFIENVPGNRYHMQVTITLDDTGEEVYRSGGIAPDSHVRSITLSKDLDAGTYDATATFTAINQETLEEVGKAAAKVSIVVRA